MAMANFSEGAVLWLGGRFNRRDFVGRLGRAATLATLAAAGVALRSPGIAHADCSGCTFTTILA
jgi:hypothetical protein